MPLLQVVDSIQRPEPLLSLAWLILLVAVVFHPISDLAVEVRLKCDARHAGGGGHILC